MNNMLLRRRVAKMESLPDFEKMYLTFVILEDNTVVKFTRQDNVNMYYSTDDGVTWTVLASDTASPAFGAGTRVLWRKNAVPKSGYGIGKFSTVTGSYDVVGNIMSILHGDNFYGSTDLKQYQTFKWLFLSDTGIRSALYLILPVKTLTNTACYTSMFQDSSITYAPNLPATTLSYGCYERMFFSCKSLVSAQSILPATALSERCYYNMFCYCAQIKESPILPAETILKDSYYGMFSGCSSLNKITCLAITTSGVTYYFSSGVASSGTFIKSATATFWGRGQNGIPNGWTVEDYTG